MKLGLYLKGGGAKGAFQAGVLKGLSDRGVNFNVISGTSIGAVNGYFLANNALNKMEELYLNSDDSIFSETVLSGKTIENKYILDKLESVLKIEKTSIEAFLVNYVEVIEGKLVERTEDILNLSSDESIQRIKWSSLLPYNQKPMTFPEFIEFIKNNDISQSFIDDLSNGIYDGINLDGGMINNFLIKEIFNYGLDKLLIIGYNGTLDEYLKDLTFLSEEDKNKIVYISRDKDFNVTDTYDFSKEFLRYNYMMGLEKGKNFNIEVLSLHNI